MPPSRNALTGIALAAVVLAGLCVAATTAGATSGDGVPGATTLMQDDTDAELRVDCDRNRVELTAAEDARHDVTVAVANLTPTTNHVSRSTVGSVEGNETVEFDGEGIVFAFARDRSDGDRVAASAVTDCATDAEETTTATMATTTESDEALEPEIAVNCTESAVRFTADSETEYVAKVVAVSVSPTSASTSSSTRTLAGNETVEFEEERLVAAFASTGELGDDRTVSAVRNCSPYGHERRSENGTDDGETDL